MIMHIANSSSTCNTSSLDTTVVNYLYTTVFSTSTVAYSSNTNINNSLTNINAKIILAQSKNLIDLNILEGFARD